MPTTEIEIRQSERDRKPKSFQSIPIKLYENQLHKINVERLHFSETTQNNQRKNGKPNPDQRYFSFVTKLIAIGIDGTCCLVQAWQSEKIIVRAGNPLQFGRPSSPEDDAMWNKTGSLMHYNGPVAIGTNRCFNNAKLTVDGNIVSTGSISHPSDRRVKENIVTLDRKQAMNRLENVRIVEFSYKPEIAKEWGLDETNRHRVGVIAQELREILPDAVKDNGELLTVDDTRIFYDTVAAAQELLEVTGNLENKIGQVEKIGAKLTRFAKKKNFMGSTLSGFTDVTSLSSESYSNHDRRHSGVITSKFTQVAIVTLIIIMACCLLGMSALYVLDWYNRNYVYKKLILPMEGQESIGNLIEQKYNISWIPPTQPLAPLLTATCGLLSNCPRYCCNGKRNNHWNDEGEVENHTKDDAMWNKTGPLMHYNGPVAIGTNRCFNNAKLTVDGNIVSTGSITHPSDRRVKENIVTLDRKQAMNRLENVRIVEFSYKPEIAKEWGLDEASRHRVGVIAQEIREILPDAVKDNGELLTVDDTRIFYDTVAAAQELLEVTGNLENKIGQVEKIGAKLTRFAKKKNFMGSTLSGFTDVTSLSSESYSNHDRRHSGVITSKFTQVAIVTLIIIMACCLLGMSALYVLDWYNRNYVYKKLILPMEGQESIGNLIEQKYNISWIPPTQPLAPLLTATCGLLSNCPRYCCNGKRNNHWNDEAEVENHTKVNPGIPLNSNVEIELLQNKMIIDQRFCVENSCDPRRGLYTLFIPISPTFPMIPLQVHFRFCVENSCDPRRGLYTLFIPISPTFPMIPLQVHFRINNGEIVDNCGSFKEFNHQTCSQNTLEYSSLPTSYGMTENNFELSVGEFIQSAYRFRIGYTTESCNMNEDQQGRSFEEYNLVFYRKC
uniref:Peptidase S74 domain-containing protein n=1 Tax=Panagrolaimus sp. JU765 TaxID=591449 RepID=A0AC34RRS2_9BILA